MGVIPQDQLCLCFLQWRDHHSGRSCTRKKAIQGNSLNGESVHYTIWPEASRGLYDTTTEFVSMSHCRVRRFFMTKHICSAFQKISSFCKEFSWSFVFDSIQGSPVIDWFHFRRHIGWGGYASYIPNCPVCRVSWSVEHDTKDNQEYFSHSFFLGHKIVANCILLEPPRA